MDITCGDCGARFRLDASLMKGGKGVQVRCRRCGGHIVVLCPEDPPVLSADDVVPIDTGVPPAEPMGGTPLAPEEGKAAGANPSGAIRTKPSVGTPEKMPVRSGPEREGFSGGRSHKPKYFIIAGLSILLLAGGAFYFGTTKSGQDMLGTLFAGSGSSRTGSAPERPAYDIRDVKWHVDKSAAGGSLFVIRGSVANVGNVPSAGIRIQAALLGKDNEALAENAAFAGNLIDEASLRQLDRAGIDAAMSNRFGEGNVNKEIPPGKALPFMLVFFDPAGTVESFMVKAIDAR